ncbi:YidB family protein [Lichenibacterium ramalinae]|nr:YidB family protein [Lichenibacterium ramalinae]
MSIFGNLGGMLGDLIAQHGGTEAILQGALQQAGGVQGIVTKLQGAGYGDAVQSWLGAGPNQPVTAEGVAQAIGHGRIGEMATRYGMQPDQVSGLLAKVLPGLIDRLSPDGTLQPHLLQGGHGGGASPLAPAS